MSDRVADYATKSLARHIKVAVSGIDNAYVVSADFDWDKKPLSNNPGNTASTRPLPFAGVVLINDNDMPFTVGNILYEKTIRASIEMCASSYTQVVNMTSDMRQALRSAVNPSTSNIGIVLYNFAVASGSYYANAGTLQLDLGQSQYFGQDEPAEHANRKFRSVTLVEMSCFKDVNATLLEGTGRINLTDT